MVRPWGNSCAANFVRVRYLALTVHAATMLVLALAHQWLLFVLTALVSSAYWYSEWSAYADDWHQAAAAHHDHDDTANAMSAADSERVLVDAARADVAALRAPAQPSAAARRITPPKQPTAPSL